MSTTSLTFKFKILLLVLKIKLKHLPQPMQHIFNAAVMLFMFKRHCGLENNSILPEFSQNLMCFDRKADVLYVNEQLRKSHFGSSGNFFRLSIFMQ